MSAGTQTAYFNLVTRLTTEVKPGTSKALTGMAGLIKGVGDKSYVAGKALQTALGFATYQIVSTAIMGITNAITGSVQAFVDFELAMANVSRTVQDFDTNAVAMTGFAIEMSKAWGLSVGDVAEAMQFMGSVGMNSNEIIRDFNDVAKMSVALQVDLEDAIQTVVKAQQVWNREAYSATQVSDILNNMTNKTALNMEFLAGALRMGGPAAAATNTSLEEMTAILVELAETGFKGTMAGRSLNTILVKMGLQSEVLLEHLTKLKEDGFDVNLQAMEGFKLASPIEQIQKLAQATDGLTNSQRIQVAQMVGGTNFLKQMLILLDNAADLENNLATAMDSRGSTQEEVNKITETTWFQIQQVEKASEALAIELGQKLQPALLLVLEAKKALIEASLTLVEVWERATDSTLGFADAQGEVDDATKTVDGSITGLGLKLLDITTAFGAWYVEQNRVHDATVKLDNIMKSTNMTQEEYDQILEKIIAGEEVFGTVLEDTTSALDRHEESLRNVGVGVDRTVDSLDIFEQALIDNKREVDAVNSATDELNRVLSYLSGEMSQAQFETERLTWYTDQAEAAYGELKYALDIANDALNETVHALNGVKDAMYDNSLATAELRLDMMLLDRAFEEGEMSEEAYKREMEALNKEMRDLRITGQTLSIENMKLNRTYEDQKESVDDLEAKIIVLHDADQRLASAMDALGEAADLLTDFLKAVEQWMGLAAETTGTFQSKLRSLETQTGTSLGGMISDWNRYGDAVKGALNADDWADIAKMLKDKGMTIQEWAAGGDGGGGGDVGGSEGAWSETYRGVKIRRTMGSSGYNYYSDVTTGYRKSVSAIRKLIRAAGYAKGFEGWVNQPTMMMVGEKGSEYVSIKNQNQQPGEGGRGGMGNVTINLPNVTSVEDSAQVRRLFRQVMLQLSGER